jgi:hypothetical protein
MRSVRKVGAAAIDRRTRLWRDISAFREGLIADLGGEDNLSAQQMAVVELAVIDRTLLMLIDGFVFGQRDPDNPLSNVLNKRNRTLYPIILQRQQIADALTNRLARLGLDRRAKVYDLDEYVVDQYGEASDE